MNTSLAWVMSRDAEVRQVIALNLCKRGMRCVELTGTGGSALPPVKPQVMVLDIDPEIGLDWGTARTLRRMPWLRGVPLIPIAAVMPLAGQLAALNPVYPVRKPLAMDELLAKVRESLAEVGPA